MKKNDYLNVQRRMTDVRGAVAGGQAAGAPAVAGAEARKKYERDVDALARKIDRFRIDGQRYFAGDLKLPPDELREEIASELRRLRNSKLATSADEFRLNSLEGRYHSHVELFGRRFREREEGGQARAPAERPELRHDPREGVLLSRDGAVEALYKGLYVRGSRTNPTMDLERFRSHLEQQAGVIRAKTGCQEIQFRIAEENGKMKIKARPIKGKAGA